MRRGLIAVSVMLAGMLALGVGCKMFEKEKKAESAKMEQISMTALPEPVSAAFAKEFPGAKVSYVGRETYPDGAIHYEIKFTDSGGKEHEIEYDPAGKHAH